MNLTPLFFPQDDINARLNPSVLVPPLVINFGFSQEILNYYHYGQAEDPYAPPSTGMGFWDLMKMAGGALAGLASGAWKAVADLATFAWQLAWSPFQTIGGILTGVAQLTTLFATGQFNDALQLIAPDLYKLLNEPQLPPYDRGFLMGKVAGEFGVPLLLGAVAPFVGKLRTMSNLIQRAKTLIGAIRNLPGIKGLNILISKMKSRAYNVWKGAYFQAKRTMYYSGERVLADVEFLLGVGRKRGDILLKNGLRVECKSWTTWSELGSGRRLERLEELRLQIQAYLRPTGSRMMIEFEGSIPAQVETYLNGLAGNYNGGQFGNRLIWTTVP